ncbi:hypothetical protein CAPTEDRAFT_114477 [Capitella teleta]|uniref:IRF tryptophan pentad repeat domain-containing protein n=1 Tax=Capitella teleta TaxID=283909 RepID=R7U8H2_CAPTE|nr:hypothetical protein CAPTEDRAFT_114477 [Capitella teleta]|eukprot:ELU02680.1 hypothetical protein CAPTEDRAFT_114477 [Capitella teleta]
MSESKQRLRPWLENILNEESVPGVRWINEEKNKFKIPWKHHGKQDWQESDAEIFMQWARHTGKYREDIDSKEFATWKTRLRCALNKAPDIEELKDVSKLDCTNPYRVYLLKDKRGDDLNKLNFVYQCIRL